MRGLLVTSCPEIFQSLGSIWDSCKLPGRRLQERPEPGHHLSDIHRHWLPVRQVSQCHPAALRLPHRTDRVLQRAGGAHGRSHRGQVEPPVVMSYCRLNRTPKDCWICVSQGSCSVQQRRGGAAGSGAGTLCPSGGQSPQRPHTGWRVGKEVTPAGPLSVVRGEGVSQTGKHGGRSVCSHTLLLALVVSYQINFGLNFPHKSNIWILDVIIDQINLQS